MQKGSLKNDECPWPARVPSQALVPLRYGNLGPPQSCQVLLVLFGVRAHCLKGHRKGCGGLTSRVAKTVPLRPLLVSPRPHMGSMPKGTGLQDPATRSQLLQGLEQGALSHLSWADRLSPAQCLPSLLISSFSQLLLTGTHHLVLPMPLLGSLTPNAQPDSTLTNGSSKCQTGPLRQSPQFPGYSQLPVLPHYPRHPAPALDCQMSLRAHTPLPSHLG